MLAPNNDYVVSDVNHYNGYGGTQEYGWAVMWTAVIDRTERAEEHR